MTEHTDSPAPATDAGLVGLVAQVGAQGRRMEQTAGLLLNALHLSPGDPGLEERIGELNAERLALADTLHQALAEAPDGLLSDRLLHAFVDAFFRIGYPEEAVVALSAAMARVPRLHDAYRQYAEAVTRADRVAETEAALRDGLAARPDDVVGRRKLAALLLKRGEVAAAAREVLTALGHDGSAFGRYGDLPALLERMKSLNIQEAITFEDAVMLHTLACRAARPGAVFVEIGSWLGMSTAILADVAAAAGAKVFAIDTWAGSDGTWQEGTVAGCSLFNGFFTNMEALGFLRTTVVPIMTRSDGCVELLPEGSVDLLFIDGDHRYDTVRGDIALWGPKVRPGGIVSGHDCERRYADLTPEELARIAENRNIDYIAGLGHGGVICAVHEAYGDAAAIPGYGTVVWWLHQTPHD